MRASRLLLPVAVTGFVAAGAWIHLQLARLAPETPIDPSTPDAVVRDLRVTEMTDAGVAGRILEAEVARHFSRQGVTEADKPVITLFRGTEGDWKVQGAQGQITHETRAILLAGGVQIDRAAAPGVEPLHIVTRDLHILDEGEYAETDQPVSIRQPGHEVTGVGLQAWLKTPVRVKLLQRVRGLHELD